MFTVTYTSTGSVLPVIGSGCAARVRALPLPDAATNGAPGTVAWSPPI